MSVKPLLPEDVLGKPIVVLVELAYAGGTWRWSDGASPDDAPSAYLPMAEIAIDVVHPLLSSSPDNRVVPIEVYFPSDADIPALVEDGHDLAAATGEVAIWVDGRDYADRLVILRGRLQEPSYNDAGRVVGSLVENPYEDKAVFPEESAVITAETWPNRDHALDGRVFPWIFGSPGVYTAANGGGDAYTTGSPALLVDTVTGNGYLMIAGHQVDASTVKVFKLSGTNSPVSATLSVVHSKDALGRVVSIVQCEAGPGGVTKEAGANYWVRWNNGGGMPERHGSRAIRGGGELILWWLERSSIRFDPAVWGNVAAQLDSYVFGGFIDDFVTPWEMVMYFLDLLPVSVVSSPAGAAPIVWRSDLQGSDVTAEIVDGEGAEIEGDIQYEGRDVINELTLSFAARADSGDFLRTKTITGQPRLPQESRDVIRASFSRASYESFGVQAGSALESDWVWAEPTADQILRAKAAYYAFPRRVVTFVCDSSWAHLRAGQVVAVSSDRFSLDRRIGIVTAIAYIGALFRCSVQLQRSPSRPLAG